jgi:prevent-host-death family protein
LKQESGLVIMKYVTASRAEEQFEILVSEVEATGEEVVITRHGRLVARLVRTDVLPDGDKLTPEEIERRREPFAKLPSE